MVSVAVSSRGSEIPALQADQGLRACERPGLFGAGACGGVAVSGGLWLVEGVFEGYEGGALGGGADFAVDVGGGVQVCVAEEA